MTTITIIGAPQSSFTWATRIFAEEKGVGYDLDPQPPHSETVTAISAVGRIPVMRAGDLALAESRAICGYLDKQGGGDSLMPRTDTEEQWLSIFQTAVDKALIRDYALAYIFPKGQDGTPDRAAIDAGLPAVDRALGAVDRALGEGAIGGARWSVLDAMLAPILFYASQFPEGKSGIDARPAVKAYLEGLMARPSFAATAPPPPS